MIIQSSTVHMGQNHQQESVLTEQKQVSIDMSHVDGRAADSGQRMVFRQQERYEFQQQTHQHYQSSAIVTDGDQTQTYAHQQVTESMIQFGLAGEAATLAAQRTFPADQLEQAGKTERIRVSGPAEISVQNSLHLKSSEFSAMQASGQIRLADGRAINFNMAMSYRANTEIEAETKASLSLVQMHDPLVINFGSRGATLTNQYFEFDLKGDGSQQQYARLGAGSGYLVLDLNGNGQVDQATELFGTQSGNGFADLARYDEDGNGWIDERDSIFQKLQLWSDQSDRSDLVTLAEKGVGAIYLGNVSQGQTLHSSSGETLGRVKSAGLVLMENGDVKTVQALDLAERRKIHQADTHRQMPEVQKVLEQLANGFNAVQQQKEAMQQHFQSRQPASQWVGLKERNSPDIKTFFEMLEAQIAKIIAQRKALLEKIEAKYQL